MLSTLASQQERLQAIRLLVSVVMTNVEMRYTSSAFSHCHPCNGSKCNTLPAFSQHPFQHDRWSCATSPALSHFHCDIWRQATLPAFSHCNFSHEGRSRLATPRWRETESGVWSDRVDFSPCWRGWPRRKSGPLPVVPSWPRHLRRRRCSGGRWPAPACRNFSPSARQLPTNHLLKSIVESAYLDEVAEDSFAAHVSVDAVVGVQEVRSEVVEQRVEVRRVFATAATVAAHLAAVYTLTPLKGPPNTMTSHTLASSRGLLFPGALLSENESVRNGATFLATIYLNSFSGIDSLWCLRSIYAGLELII